MLVRVNPACPSCGREDRILGVAIDETATVALMVICDRCGVQRVVKVDPLETAATAARWDDAASRMKALRSQ